jgi:hypothetical protein
VSAIDKRGAGASCIRLRFLYKRSGDPALGEYGEATLICKEGDLPDSVDEMLAA